MYFKKFIPLHLAIFFIVALLSHSIAFAEPKTDCENLSELFTPLGQMVIGNLTTPPLENLCRHIFKGKTYADRGSEGKAIRQLEIFIRITTNNTPESISEPARDAFNEEALRLINLMEIRLGLPADPGEEGKATLAGIDSDGDGVRDDLQRFIALSHPDSAKFRAVLTQYTINLQEKLINAGDPIKSLELAHQHTKDSACHQYIDSVSIHSEQGRAKSPRKELYAQALNTLERSRAYLDYNDHLPGHTFVAPEPASYDLTPLKKYCDFDSDLLPN